MATTPNLGLHKPARTDLVSVVTDINNNMDTLDSKIGAVPAGHDVEEQITTLSDQIGTLNTAIANLETKIENSVVQALRQVDPGTTETEYTLLNDLKMSDYKMLVATRSWYSNVIQSQCVPTNAFVAPLEVKDGNDYVKVTFVSDTKVKVVSSQTNMRCSIYLTR